MKPSQVLDSLTTQSNWIAWFRNQDNGLAELVNVTIRSTQKFSPQDGVSLILNGKKYQKQIGVSRDFGEARVPFEVTEFSSQSVAKVDWRIGKKSVHWKQVVSPQKKWTLF